MTNRIEVAGAKADVRSFALLPFAAVLLASALFLSGCNTMEGMGEDVQSAGEQVEDAAD